ncbi:isochorismatase family protein [Planctomycetaceae bacterium SH139]
MNSAADSKRLYEARACRPDSIVRVGIATTSCIEATDRSAVDLGYHVTLVTDAVATFSRKEHHTTVAEIYPQIAHAVLDTNQLVNALQTEKVTHDS